MNHANDSMAAVEKEIGLFVRAKRKEAGLSQEVLAARCGIVRRTLFSLEAGEGGNLRSLLAVLCELDLLEEFAQVFQLPREEEGATDGGHGIAAEGEDASENPWVMSDHAVL